MPIVDLQRRLAEVGRIRLGRQVESRSGKKHPAALDTFRLTSTDRARIDEASKRYGGTVTKWDESPSGIPQWEVITKADRLAVIVPPSVMAFSQNYELWSAGGCQRRCDGVTEFIGEQPCLCDPENRQCEIHTRLSVMLSELKGLGVWRVDTTGYYAALEIKGQVDTLEFFAGQGRPLPAILRLDQRVIKRPDEGTKRFVVPVLDVDVTPGDLLMGTIAIQPAAAQPAALTPVPDSGAKPASIADQVASSEAIPSRRRATPIKATGIAPRTAAQRTGARGYRDPWEAAEEDRRGRSDDPEQGAGAIPTDCPNCEVTAVRATAQGWRCANCGIDDQEAYDKGLGGWVIKDDRHSEHPPGYGQQSEEEAYAALEAERDAARAAAAATQDQPRMVTHGQLTKLGILLTNAGFAKGPKYDTVEEARVARLAFCSAETKRLMPDSPWAGRPLNTSKELTFDEANLLINTLEAGEQTAKQPEPQPDPEPPTAAQPGDEDVAQPVDQKVQDAETDEEYYERLEREESEGVNSADTAREPEADQLNLL